VTPAAGATAVRPEGPVVVAVTDGRLTSVTVTDARKRVLNGTLAADGTSWTAPGPLRLDAAYAVTADAVDAAGLANSSTTHFTTVKPKADLTTSISPLRGSTVGVGMPIVVRLSDKATNRAEVQNGLTVTTSRPVEGAWSWVGDKELHYRPKAYWPAGTNVSLTVRLRGVDAGAGVWGDENRTVAFNVGASMVSVVDVNRLRMTVRRNGKVARTIPVSTGKAGFLTRNGIKVISEKHRLKVMDASTIGIGKSSPDYYRLDVPYAMRITNSGEFVHAAPWSVGSQGRVRVSHGCVGMSTANAIWLFNQTHVGDVVRVVGSPRQLEPGNGWTDWNVPWSTWREGSAV
jgi:lipoprotein-anchoring transpeptidase ErfK/SrfK